MNAIPFAEPLGLAATAALGAMAPFLALPLVTLAAGAATAPTLRTAIGLCEDIAHALSRFAQLCLLVLALGMLATVLLRYIFGESRTQLSEAVMYAHALAFLMAAPAALVRNAHVRVDLFYERMNARGRAWVDLLGFSLLMAPVLLLLLVYSGPVVALAWRIGERSPETDGLPLVWLLKTAMPVFAVALLAAGVAQAGRAALLLRGLPGGGAPETDQDAAHRTHAGAAP